jgi:hypothetical protein
MSGYVPLHMNLMIDATKHIRLEGTVGTGVYDSRRQRVSAKTYGGGVVRVA